MVVPSKRSTPDENRLATTFLVNSRDFVAPDVATVPNCDVRSGRITDVTNRCEDADEYYDFHLVLMTSPSCGDAGTKVGFDDGKSNPWDFVFLCPRMDGEKEF